MKTVKKVSKLFVGHEGQYHAILPVVEMPSYLNIKSENLEKIFGHIAKFGESGKPFGLIQPTREQLVEAQQRLDVIRLEEKEERRTQEWLQLKILAARKEIGLD